MLVLETRMVGNYPLVVIICTVTICKHMCMHASCIVQVNDESAWARPHKLTVRKGR